MQWHSFACLLCLFSVYAHSSKAPKATHKLSFLSQEPEDAPVNGTNMLATQTVSMYHDMNCAGNSTSFTSSGNSFLSEFLPYAKNLWSAKLCGKGTFFYFATPEMHMLSTLGHLSRCGPEVTKDTDDCTCGNLKPEMRTRVRSFSLQYC